MLLLFIAAAAGARTSDNISTEINHSCATGTTHINIDCYTHKHQGKYSNQELPKIIPKNCNETKEKLVSLKIQNCNLRGNIPQWISHFTHLQELILKNNYFSGSVPPEIHNLPHLSICDLAGNCLNTGKKTKCFDSPNNDDGTCGADPIHHHGVVHPTTTPPITVTTTTNLTSTPTQKKSYHTKTTQSGSGGLGIGTLTIIALSVAQFTI